MLRISGQRPALVLFFQIRLKFSSFSTLFDLFFSLFCLFSTRHQWCGLNYIVSFSVRSPENCVLRDWTYHLSLINNQQSFSYVLYEPFLGMSGKNLKNLRETTLLDLPQKAQRNSQITLKPLINADERRKIINNQ